MKFEVFNENYDLTRNGRAVPKNILPPLAVRLTADGQNFDVNTNYYFFDENKTTVRESSGLISVGEYLTGANGFKIVPIDRLRKNKNDAFADGQNYLREEIKKALGLIAKFELEKVAKTT